MERNAKGKGRWRGKREGKFIRYGRDTLHNTLLRSLQLVATQSCGKFLAVGALERSPMGNEALREPGSFALSSNMGRIEEPSHDFVPRSPAQAGTGPKQGPMALAHLSVASSQLELAGITSKHREAKQQWRLASNLGGCSCLHWLHC
jgi:hypothetical protein